MQPILLITFLFSFLSTFSQTSISPKNDYFSTTPINSYTGGTTVSVLANDSINGIPNSATLSNVTLTWLTTAPTGLTLNADGTISVATNTSADIYKVNYRICGILNPGLCREAYAVVMVDEDSDGDAISDFYDADADNDGVLNENECAIDLLSIYVPNNFTNNTLFLQLRPSDFGFTTLGAKNLSGSHDYSSFFGLPSGSIIAEVENANVHPTANEFYVGEVTGTSPKTQFKISGTLGVYLAIEHGQEFQSVMERSITFLHGATTGTGLMDLGTQPTGGNWQSGNIDQRYYLRHLTTGRQDAPLAYADLYPARKPKLFEISTNNPVVNNWSTYFIRIFPECDSDKDGIPNRLDLDSDNDGCLDALEGSGGYIHNQLVNAGGSLSVGSGSTAQNQNLCADISCVSINGTPTIAGAGQLPGSAYDVDAMSAICIQMLPVKLANFNVFKRGITAQLEWITTHEVNNMGFEVEKSADGQIWQRIAFVKSRAENGQSSSRIQYEFTDLHLANNNNFYRLKQVDFDGKFEYSKAQKLIFGLEKRIMVYPNPSTHNVTIRGVSAGDVIEFYDTAGRKVKTSQCYSSVNELSIAELKDGLYYLIIKNRNEIRVLSSLIKGLK